jgi:hypothetical protein
MVHLFCNDSYSKRTFVPALAFTGLVVFFLYGVLLSPSACSAPRSFLWNKEKNYLKKSSKFFLEPVFYYQGPVV